jgi:hypothetical protein
LKFFQKILIAFVADLSPLDCIIIISQPHEKSNRQIAQKSGEFWEKICAIFFSKNS